MTTERQLPKISIVTCSLNHGEFLEDCILSVLNQSYPRLEYIIMDGGSTDKSINVIRKYENHLHYWVSERDSGQTSALNKGFERASGDIYGWLCSDDLLEPNCLSDVARLFQLQPDVSVVYGDTYLIDKEGVTMRHYKSFPYNRWLLLYTSNYIPQPSTFWRAGLFHDVGGLNSVLEMCMDCDLWLRFSDFVNLHHVKKTWSRIRMYPDIKSIRCREQADGEFRGLLDRYYGKELGLNRRAKKVAARLIRIGWRAILGCYFP